MKRLVIFAVLGTVLTISGGVGLSAAHTMGLFGPAQTDWLITDRRVTPVSPRITQTPQAATPVVIAAPAPQLSVPQVVDAVQIMTPLASITPRVRPDRMTPEPTVQARVSLPLQTTPLVSRLSTRQSPAPLGLLEPVSRAPTAPQAIDRVWMLGVYR